MYKAFDIVLTPFPFTDLSGKKVRPALILGSQSHGDDVTVCFISSRVEHVHDKIHKLDVFIDSKGKAFPKTGLKVDSVIRTTKIATLDKVVVMGKIGELDGANIRKVKGILKMYFGL